MGKIETIEKPNGHIQVVEVLMEFDTDDIVLNRRAADDACRTLANMETKYHKRVEEIPAYIADD